MNYKLLFYTSLSTILVGLIHLPQPFFGDQAFFLLGAKEMNDGLILYRDFWDIKQPGIFLFYLAGGKLFGFNEIGIHFFELLYWLIFNYLSIWFLVYSKLFKTKILTYLTPFLIIATYYSFSNSFLLTQVEALVNFPLLLNLICCYLFIKHHINRYLCIFLIGITTGLVLYFKFIFAIILAIFYIYVYLVTFKSIKLKDYLLYPLLLLGGIVIIWFPFILYCFEKNIIQLCYDTFINYPPLIIKNVESTKINYLIDSGRHFFIKLVLIFPLAIFTILVRFREKYFINLLWIWFTISLLVIALQKTSWYIYHFQIVLTPIIFLSIALLDIAFVNVKKIVPFIIVKNETYAKIAILLLLNSLLISTVSYKIFEMSKFNFAISKSDRLNYQLSQADNKKAFDASRWLLDRSASNDPIYVINDPLVYYYAQRNQAVSISSWSMRIFVPGQMNQLIKELESKKPTYIYIDNTFNQLLEQNEIELSNWIRNNYAPETISVGTWFRKL